MFCYIRRRHGVSEGHHQLAPAKALQLNLILPGHRSRVREMRPRAPAGYPDPDLPSPWRLRRGDLNPLFFFATHRSQER